MLLRRPNTRYASSAVGVNPAQDEAWRHRLAAELHPPEALIRYFLTDPGYTVGPIGTPGTGFMVLPPLVIGYSTLDPEQPPTLTYGSKAGPESPCWRKPSLRQALLPSRAR